MLSHIAFEQLANLYLDFNNFINRDSYPYESYNYFCDWPEMRFAMVKHSMGNDGF